MNIESVGDLTLLKLCLKAKIFTVEEYKAELERAAEVACRIKRMHISNHPGTEFKEELEKVSKAREDLLMRYLTTKGGPPGQEEHIILVVTGRIGDAEVGS